MHKIPGLCPGTITYTLLITWRRRRSQGSDLITMNRFHHPTSRGPNMRQLGHTGMHRRGILSKNISRAHHRKATLRRPHSRLPRISLNTGTRTTQLTNHLIEGARKVMPIISKLMDMPIIPSIK